MREHWDRVYRENAVDAVSWYRPRLDSSLALLERCGLGADSRVLDAGGGASTLAAALAARGVAEVTVVDLSEAALAQAHARAPAAAVRWLCADLLEAELSPAHYTHWHDRAVLHFLADPAAVAAYARQAARVLQAGGHAVIGGFAPDGPERCSGLPVMRRSPEDIAAALGPAFRLVDQQREVHLTPAGREQRFAWAVLRRT